MTTPHFETLAHPYRQRILVALFDEDDTIRVPEDLRYRDVTSEINTIRLQDVDRPKLAEAGLIQWDRDTSTVSRGPDFEAIRPLLRTLADEKLLSVPETLLPS